MPIRGVVASQLGHSATTFWTAKVRGKDAGQVTQQSCLRFALGLGRGEPHRSSRNSSAREVEGSTHSDEDWCFQFRAHPVYPRVLLGRSESHPDDIGMSRIDPVGSFVGTQTI